MSSSRGSASGAVSARRRGRVGGLSGRWGAAPWAIFRAVREGHSAGVRGGRTVAGSYPWHALTVNSAVDGNSIMQLVLHLSNSRRRKNIYRQLWTPALDLFLISALLYQNVRFAYLREQEPLLSACNPQELPSQHHRQCEYYVTNAKHTPPPKHPPPLSLYSLLHRLQCLPPPDLPLPPPPLPHPLL